MSVIFTSSARSTAAIAFAFLFAAAAAMAVVTGCNASCKPMDVNGISGNCNGGATGYMWTGTSCIYTRSCNCSGADCQRLYPSQSSCDNAHLHCSPGSK
jgi:hypothetical protein